jgi:hypothetical protein
VSTNSHPQEASPGVATTSCSTSGQRPPPSTPPPPSLTSAPLGEACVKTALDWFEPVTFYGFFVDNKPAATGGCQAKNIMWSSDTAANAH